MEEVSSFKGCFSWQTKQNNAAKAHNCFTAHLTVKQAHTTEHMTDLSGTGKNNTCHDNYTAGRLSLWFTFAICYKFFILVVVISMHFHVTTCEKKSKHDWVSKNTSSGQSQQETQQCKWSSLYHDMHKRPCVESATATNNCSGCAAFHFPLNISQIFLFLVFLGTRVCVCVCVCV